MAISFITSLPKDQVLNAYNNNVIEFSSDVEKPNIKAIITIGSLNFESTPSPADEYYFNFKSIIQALINANYFQDLIEPENENTMVYPDATLYQEITADLSVEFDDGTTDDQSINLAFIKAVDQEEAYKRNTINQINNQIALLLPFIPDSNQDYHATYFEGYPFDVAIYSDADRAITINNRATGISAEFQINKGVNRLFLSDGDNNFSVDEIVPLQPGINKLDFYIGETSKVTLHLTKADSICGSYYKWFNDQGGWSYFLFHKYDETVNTKSTESFFQDFKNLNNSDDRFFDLGLEVEYSDKYFTEGISQNEMALIKSLMESPKVYRYLNKQFQTGKRTDWITEKIKPGKLRTFNRIRNTYDVVIEIERPKQNRIVL
ncbi:hypothetical protein [Leeuwenhoekiella nanhaiensis]|uniref:Uncharacterized protein n=1 Tax=Leeuwenhoekiella nanhaiensis TaxID=1655491 RepID=A0A2G1VM60_9FLAO|nr:hypothetical protein [Leeuwenhoekiella nanhaiensis]PHQ27856.1 hypothetical protein CJ305_17785 [Leeuwenhoekiella nanhaiensis]